MKTKKLASADIELDNATEGDRLSAELREAFVLVNTRQAVYDFLDENYDYSRQEFFSAIELIAEEVWLGKQEEKEKNSNKFDNPF